MFGSDPALRCDCVGCQPRSAPVGDVEILPIAGMENVSKLAGEPDRRLAEALDAQLAVGFCCVSARFLLAKGREHGAEIELGEGGANHQR